MHVWSVVNKSAVLNIEAFLEIDAIVTCTTPDCWYKGEEGMFFTEKCFVIGT